MTAQYRAFRIRVRTPEDDADLLIASSRPGEDPDHPYWEDVRATIRHDGQSVDPLTGRVTIGSVVVPLIDWFGTFPVARAVDWQQYHEDVEVVVGCDVGDEPSECPWVSDETGWFQNPTTGEFFGPPPYLDWTDGELAVLDGNCWNMSIGEANGAFYAEAVVRDLDPDTTYTWQIDVSSPSEGTGISNDIYAGVWMHDGTTLGSATRFLSGNSLKESGKGFLENGELTPTPVTQTITNQPDASGNMVVKLGVWSTEVGDVCRRLQWENSSFSPSAEGSGRIVTSVLHHAATARGQFLSRKAFVEIWDDPVQS